jgi:outer membrane receptor protein involved in Fe transport
MIEKRLTRAMRLALFATGALGMVTCLPAMAQDSEIEEEGDIEEVVVTGSRIATRDAMADSPIYTIDQEAFRDSGFVTVEQYMNTMPQIVPGLSSQSNNPSSNGRAFIDLRGLGNNRNLVLIDGRRGMGSTAGAVVDVNTIPAALIERVEIISGGAAAVYGADAVAGVVNFIMKKSFDGLALDSSYRLTEEGDGDEVTADITFGGDFADGRGSAVFNLSYFDRKELYKGARDFSAQAGAQTGTFPGGGWSTGANQPSQAAVDAVFGAGACPTTGGQAGFQFNPDGSLFCTGIGGNSTYNVVGYNGPDDWIATRWFPDNFSYNFEPDNLLVLPMERWNIYSHFDLEVNEYFKPYATAMFTNYNATQELAPTPAAGSTGFTVPVTNPFLPDSMRAMLASRPDPDAPFSFSKRFKDLGGRTGANDHDVWQTTVGATGLIAGSWNYDAYGSFGRSNQLERQGGNVRLPRVQELLEAADGGASNPNCPGGLNLFGASPNVTFSDACGEYISLEAKNQTLLEQAIVEVVATGTLFELPAGPVQAAFGTSYRNVDFDFRPDSGLQPGLVAGFNQQLPISGRLQYMDYYGEVSVPILEDIPFIQKLSATGGYRVTDNNVFGSDDSWKLTLDWQIVDNVRARGGFQHAVRSPNIAELFAPQVNNFPTFTNQDPCNTTGPNASNPEFGRNGPNGAAVQALCAAQSAVAGGPNYVQPFGQATAIVGGNPDLEPEQADSWTLGVVWDDVFSVDRLSVSLDYFDIDLEDVIAAVNAQTIVQRCFNRDGANPTYSIDNSWCQLFNREQSNGGVIDLQQLSQNQAFIKTSGIDFTFNWGLLVGPGDLTFQSITSWLDKFETQTTSVDPVYDFAGTVSSITAASAPEWKSNLVTNYAWDNWRVQMTTRYIDGMKHANTVTGGSPLTNTSVSSVWYWDLMGVYELTSNLTLRAGVNNLFDEDPQLYTPFVQANTDPSLYDILGRRYFVGLNWRM